MTRKTVLKIAIPSSALLFAVLLWIFAATPWGLPWETGDQACDGWQVSQINEHAEFIRFKLVKENEETSLELTANRSGNPGVWSTPWHRLQPGPQSSPPEKLLLEMMDQLRGWEDSFGGGSLFPDSRKDDSRKLPYEIWLAMAVWLLMAPLLIVYGRRYRNFSIDTFVVSLLALLASVVFFNLLSPADIPARFITILQQGKTLGAVNHLYGLWTHESGGFYRIVSHLAGFEGNWQLRGIVRANLFFGFMDCCLFFLLALRILKIRWQALLLTAWFGLNFISFNAWFSETPGPLLTLLLLLNLLSADLALSKEKQSLKTTALAVLCIMLQMVLAASIRPEMALLGLAALVHIGLNFLLQHRLSKASIKHKGLGDFIFGENIPVKFVLMLGGLLFVAGFLIDKNILYVWRSAFFGPALDFLKSSDAFLAFSALPQFASMNAFINLILFGLDLLVKASGIGILGNIASDFHPLSPSFLMFIRMQAGYLPLGMVFLASCGLCLSFGNSRRPWYLLLFMFAIFKMYLFACGTHWPYMVRYGAFFMALAFVFAAYGLRWISLQVETIKQDAKRRMLSGLLILAVFVPLPWGAVYIADWSDSLNYYAVDEMPMQRNMQREARYLMELTEAHPDCVFVTHMMPNKLFQNDPQAARLMLFGLSLPKPIIMKKSDTDLKAFIKSKVPLARCAYFYESLDCNMNYADDCRKETTNLKKIDSRRFASRQYVDELEWGKALPEIRLGLYEVDLKGVKQ